MKTAEWECTSCGATNRRLVDNDETKSRDRCGTCKMWHVIEEDERPVRWRSKAA